METTKSLDSQRVELEPVAFFEKIEQMSIELKYPFYDNFPNFFLFFFMILDTIELALRKNKE